MVYMGMARSMPGNSTYQPSFALCAGLAWLVIAGQLLWFDWAQTATALGDTDDAMRLLEVREFLAGRGWFDLHEPRMQPPTGYDTHWSRFVDAGLAGVFLIIHAFTDVATAERLMRVVWPLLWIGPALAGTAAIAWRLGGRAAAFVALLLLLFGLPAFVQFRPGRIDHHDIQISLALLTIAAAIWADRIRWTPWAAGVLTAFALAIGFEGIPFVVIGGAIFAARFVLDRNHSLALVHYGLATAASTAVAFLLSVGPGHWTQTACDAIAVNSAAPLIVGGLALAGGATWFVRPSIMTRCSVIAIAIATMAGVFALIEPRCLGGPLAMVDPAVKPIWLAHVIEAKSVFETLRSSPVLGIGVVAYPIAAAIAMIMLACDEKMRRDEAFIVVATVEIVAIAMTIIAVRASAYTLWFGVPLVAAALPRIFDWFKFKTLPARALVVLALSPVVICFGAIALSEALGVHQAKAGSQRDDGCLAIKSYASLAKLAPGLVVADVDLGPFILALTPHSVLAGPYHRLSYGIIASYRTFAAPPDQAREILRQAGATYVVTCGERGPRDLPEPVGQQSLWRHLTEGRPPNWLEAIPESGPIAIYRFKQ
jgi:hypothetical protein